MFFAIPFKNKVSVMSIRRYTIADKKELISLLRLNIPRYFAVSEEADFAAYLENHAEHYFVVEEAGKIIGSGGINYFLESNSARISWDIIHPEFQGKGVGKALTLYRIKEINNNPAVNLIIVRTTQLVFEFYQKMGFELEKTEKDYWEKGFDLYQMKMTLDPSVSLP